MISNKPKPTLKQKRIALIWTGLVTDAVSRAKTSTKIVVIGVAKLKTAYMLQDTLTAMAIAGEEAAWNVEVQLNTLH